jgi:hypothetical protein
MGVHFFNPNNMLIEEKYGEDIAKWDKKNEWQRVGSVDVSKEFDKLTAKKQKAAAEAEEAKLSEPETKVKESSLSEVVPAPKKPVKRKSKKRSKAKKKGAS